MPDQRLCSFRLLPPSAVVDRNCLILLAFTSSISRAPADRRNWPAVRHKARGQPPLEFFAPTGRAHRRRAGGSEDWPGRRQTACSVLGAVRKDRCRHRECKPRCNGRQTTAHCNARLHRFQHLAPARPGGRGLFDGPLQARCAIPAHRDANGDRFLGFFRQRAVGERRTPSAGRLDKCSRPCGPVRQMVSEQRARTKKNATLFAQTPLPTALNPP